MTGKLAFAASLRDRSTGRYAETASAQQYGEAETNATLTRLHIQAFHRWLETDPDRLSRDLATYAASVDGGIARLGCDRLDWAKQLTPADATAQEAQLLAERISNLLDSLCLKGTAELGEREEMEQTA